MLDLEKTREKIIALIESDAKSILMLTAANIQMVRGGNGSFTSDNCVDTLIELFNSIPEPKEEKGKG
ncbi:hypothetical protein G8C92_09510 [Paenibacillus donghaensis]|uniref:hypothetical protein n=1 Tax=Paenibacillus donghaensis TaxID=414771 RepID=UPI0018846293|nr:hypothetical protein [Paenibacillus donghaensis]MBE9914266.1 hypothetical protein [Paenibacillus donghaensis]